jgi:hypothetical protein
MALILLHTLAPLLKQTISNRLKQVTPIQKNKNEYLKKSNHRDQKERRTPPPFIFGFDF